MKKAIKHKGFAAIEILFQCPTYAGRYILNKPDPRDMLQWFKENSVPLTVAKKRDPEELKGKILVGEFLHRTDRVEYTEKLKELEKRAKGG